MDRLCNGLPVVNHLLQHTLRSICADSHWVYAVFWRILPRNYPPPKWDNETGFLDRSKGNKRNWILTWEDGFCDFAACARNAAMQGDEESLQPELFFKMSHEVYSYGEGLMGKVASDSSHKWIFKDPSEQDASFLSPWHGALDPQPRTWDSQFKAGIQTIAIVAVQEGLLQLGSLEKVFEDLNLVIMLQRKFTYLQSVPGVFAPHPNTALHSMQRPRIPLLNNSNRYAFQDDSMILGELPKVHLTRTLSSGSAELSFYQDARHEQLLVTENQQQQLVGAKRLSREQDPLTASTTLPSNGRMLPDRPPLSKSLNTGHSPPGVQPSMTSLHALLSKLPSISAEAAAAAAVAVTATVSTGPMDTSRMLLVGHEQQQFLMDTTPCENPQSVLKVPRDAMQNDSPTSTSSSTRTCTVLPDASSTKISRNNSKMSHHYLEVFDCDYSELDTYNSLLSEITK